MSETKWTPGPWRVDYQTANAPGDERLGVFSGAYSDEEPGICFGSRAWPLIRADADLIAAAPDLYESTHSLLSWLAKGGHDYDCAAMLADDDGPAVPCSCGYSESLRAARAALAKARGEQP